MQGSNEALAALIRDKERRGRAFPRCGVIVLAHAASADGARPDPAMLRATLARIPAQLVPLLCEITLLCEGSDDAPSKDFERQPWPNLRVQHNPRRYGYGGRRKIAFEYALEQRFEHVILLEGDGSLPPEELPLLFAAAVLEEHAVVVAARTGARAPLVAALHNALLGMQLADWESGLRAFATAVLRRIPFELDSDERSFDTQLLIQCRALGVPVAQVDVQAPLRPASKHERFRLWPSLASVFDYRLHQLHWSRRGRYLVDQDVHYTFKRSSTSSHMQVFEAIRAGSRVLDLGCSQGLLARPLREKNVRVTGVDARAGEEVSVDLDAYHRRDLEAPLDLPEGRVFDYVVLSDVIEHVQRRRELLRSARRYLKPDGRLLISTPNIAIWFYRLSLFVGRFEYGPRGILDETHVHLYTRATFWRAVEQGGFRVLEERVTALPFEVVFESTGQSRVVRLLSRAYHALARLWPEMFAYQFVLEAEVSMLLDGESDRGTPTENGAT